MVVRLSPFGGAGWQFFDNSGELLSGGLIYTYEAGSTTPVDTYTTSLGTVKNSNPIVLNSSARLPNEVWLIEGQEYKFVLKTSTGTLIETIDNISGINDTGDIPSVVTGVAGESLSVGDIVRSASGLIYKTDNTTAAGVTNFVGVVTIGGAPGDTVSITRFEYDGFVGLTSSSACYLGTGGTLTQVKPTTYPKTIGFAKNATTLVITSMSEENTSFSSINVRNTGTFYKDVSVGTTLGVTGAANLSSTLGVTGLSTFTGIKTAVVSKTTTYTATTSDHVIQCSGSAFTVNLPACSGNTGLEFIIIKTDSSLTNIVTIDANGSETINGSLTTTLNTQYESIHIICDGTSNWDIINRNIPSIWQSATTTITGSTSNPTKGTTIVDRLLWRRVGSDAIMRLEYEQSTGGSAGNGDYLFAMPTGLNMNSSFVTFNSTIGQANGQFSIGWALCRYDSDALNGIIIPHSASLFRIGLTINSPGVMLIISSVNTPLSFNNITYTATMTVPITGWND